MHRTTKLRRIGTSSGVILPKEILEDLHVGDGDELIVTRTAEGVTLTPYDPNFARAMEAFERGRKKYRNALRELAE